MSRAPLYFHDIQELVGAAESCLAQSTGIEIALLVAGILGFPPPGAGHIQLGEKQDS